MKKTKVVRLYITEEIKGKIKQSGASIRGYTSACILKASELDHFGTSAYQFYMDRPKVKPMQISLADEIYSLIKDKFGLIAGGQKYEIPVNKSKYVNLCVYHFLEGVNNV